ncbi:MAG TPA: cytochrome o ubiquinol oxidase subunit III [Candidatus Saccharimonadales bacterium]|nr:cytochrome o ubiquinol oxidase subunit III [Candidatus Saccharimonadales bacterium]HSX27436.1 cytochrome o ubiquinol oxidase subunit III [Patescibacteria group bacterium]
MNHEEEANDRIMFGFWVYLMTDLLMFSVLFAVYAVLHGNTAGGPTGRELFSPHVALTETLILLTSSFTCGIAMIAARQGNKSRTLFWFAVTFLLGLAFLSLELREFAEFIHQGHTMQTNAFLSSFFVLVGTHGLHITSGLIWMAITTTFVVKRGLDKHLVRKLSMLSLFWHFLDIVWIFIFTVVYLGAFV